MEPKKKLDLAVSKTLRARCEPAHSSSPSAYPDVIGTALRKDGGSQGQIGFSEGIAVVIVLRRVLARSFESHSWCNALLVCFQGKIRFCRIHS